MKQKSKIRGHLVNFRSYIETQFSSWFTWIMVWTFMHDLDNFEGIIYQIMFVECPQQYGTVERKYQHILNGLSSSTKVCKFNI